jgi:hypothetical protein
MKPSTRIAAPALAVPSRRAARAIRLAPVRVRRGRPVILGLRLLGGLMLAEAVLHSGAGPAPIAGTLAGIATWLALTARADLAPPPDGTP